MLEQTDRETDRLILQISWNPPESCVFFARGDYFDFQYSKYLKTILLFIFPPTQKKHNKPTVLSKTFNLGDGFPPFPPLEHRLWRSVLKKQSGCGSETSGFSSKKPSGRAFRRILGINYWHQGGLDHGNPRSFCACICGVERKTHTRAMFLSRNCGRTWQDTWKSWNQGRSLVGNRVRRSKAM